MKIDHLGIAVKSLEQSVPVFEKIFGVTASPMELLEGTAPDSPISKFIEKKGEGIHHCSFGVNDIIDKLYHLDNAGINLIDKTPKTGADDMLIAFLHPKSTAGILMELSQKKSH